MGLWKNLFGDSDPDAARIKNLTNFVSGHIAACSVLIDERLENMSAREERCFMAFLLGVLDYCYETFEPESGQPHDLRFEAPDQRFSEFLRRFAERQFPEGVSANDLLVDFRTS